MAADGANLRLKAVENSIDLYTFMRQDDELWGLRSMWNLHCRDSRRHGKSFAPHTGRKPETEEKAGKLPTCLSNVGSGTSECGDEALTAGEAPTSHSFFLVLIQTCLDDDILKLLS